MRQERRIVDPRRDARNRKRKRKEKIMRCIIAVLLCAGITVQTVLIVRLAGKNREAARLQAQINQLESDTVNYELAIGSNGDRSAMKERAMNVLGMVEPGAEQIRVIHVPTDNTDTRLAMNTQAE